MIDACTDPYFPSSSETHPKQTCQQKPALISLFSLNENKEREKKKLQKHAKGPLNTIRRGFLDKNEGIETQTGMILTIKQLKLAKKRWKGGEEDRQKHPRGALPIPSAPPPSFFLLAVPKHRLARENASQILLDTTFLLFLPWWVFLFLFRPRSFLFCYHSLYIHASSLRAARSFPSPHPSCSIVTLSEQHQQQKRRP